MHIAHFARPDRLADPLYVITPIFNSPRYRVRWKHVEDFGKRCAEAGAVLYVIECAFGDREFVIPQTPCDNATQVIHVRTPHELWLKENMINIAMSRLPLDWKYVAWIDADTVFARDDWANETLHTLQHYKIIQMFSWYLDLNPEFEPHGIPRPSFTNRWLNPDLPASDGYDPGPGGKALKGAPGLAWAARRKTIDDLGGLMDWQILGSADSHMAHALFGKLEDALRPQYHPGYTDPMYVWQKRAQSLVGPQWVGMMPGLALHSWHGHKSLRKYGKRDQILVSNGFNPSLDLKHDAQGVLQLTDRVPQLRDDVRRYFHERNEDSVHVPGA